MAFLPRELGERELYRAGLHTNAHFVTAPQLSSAASGHTNILCAPDVDKTLDRGPTEYFARGRNEEIGAFGSPKYVGVELGTVARIATDHFDITTNADGL